MLRHTLCISVFVALTLIAAAQEPKPRLTALQQQQLFQRNREMIKTLVDSSLEISNKSGDYIERSLAYRKVIMELQKELDNAANSEDAGRVTELGSHLNTVLARGLRPSLEAASMQIGAGGTGRERLVEIRDETIGFVDWLQNKARNKWADTPEIRQVIDSLENTKKDLGASVGSELRSGDKR
jgi:hypothetical protein